MNVRPRNDSGFTLVEIMVALFLFAILSAGSLTVLTSSVNAKDQINQMNDSFRSQSIARILLKRDLDNTILIPKQDEFGQNAEVYFFGGEYGQGRVLSLSRTGWDNPGGIEARSNLQSVEYTFEKGALVRKTKARFNAPLSSPDFEQVLYQDIDKLKWQFFDGEQWLESWQVGPEPSVQTSLPRAASLELTFNDRTSLKQYFLVGADR